MRCSLLIRRIELKDGQVHSNIYVIVRLGKEFIINECFYHLYFLIDLLSNQHFWLIIL
jgi:hypothetical protein